MTGLEILVVVAWAAWASKGKDPEQARQERENKILRKLKADKRAERDKEQWDAKVAWVEGRSRTHPSGFEAEPGWLDKYEVWARKHLGDGGEK